VGSLQEIAPLGAPPERASAASVWLRIAGYGTICGLLLALLRWVDYRWLVVEHSIEIWGGLIAALFSALGIALGLRLTRSRVERVLVPVEIPPAIPVAGPFAVDERRQRELGVTPRELEILGLISAGLSNREIAETLFVSENTVKTHSSRLFDKLGARRRTQAVQLGRAAGLLPGDAVTRKHEIGRESPAAEKNHQNG
jgi:NarL family two-component system response regulator LiaR